MPDFKDLCLWMEFLNYMWLLVVVDKEHKDAAALNQTKGKP